MDIVQYLPITDGENNKIERSRTTNLGKLELETMEMHVDALENELEIVGRYDDHTFYFAAQRLREKNSSLELRYLEKVQVGSTFLPWFSRCR